MGLFDVTGIWLVALGKTTLHSLWIGLLVLALLRITLQQIPIRFSNIRYTISVAALLILFSSSVGTFLLLYRPSLNPGQSVSPLDLIPVVSGILPIDNSWSAGSGIYRLFIIFGQIYFAGALAMLIRSTVSLLRLRRLRNSSTRVGPGWQSRLTQISESLGIRRAVDFLESDRITGPLLTGIFKPAIIVPAGLITHLPFSQIETIMMHELYHLKRRDYLVNLMQLFIEGVLFYHPVVWAISGLIRDEREHCCDDEVLRMTENPVEYARALIYIAENQQFIRIAPGATGNGRYHLKFRINRILNTNTMKTKMHDRVISIALLTGTIILFLVISSFSAGPSIFRTGVIQGEMSYQPDKMTSTAVQDTIPEKSQAQEAGEEVETSPREVSAVSEEARQKALEEIEEIDWDEIGSEMEEARQKALQEIEEIDPEEIMEARQEALEEIGEIDLDEIRAEIEQARQEAIDQIEEIDWDQLKSEMESARMEMQEIDLEELKQELEKGASEIKIDVEQMKRDLQNSIREVDWEQIRRDMEKSVEFFDSIRIELKH
jgi:bla regulator protein blaR1